MKGTIVGAVKSDDEYKKEMKAKHEAMVKRLESLPDDNEVIEAAIQHEEEMIDDMKGGKDKYEQWDPCQKLVSTAYSEFEDGKMNLKEALRNLGEALIALSDKS